MSWPACVSSAIGVGATTKADAVAAYSNSAVILDLLAPGSSITSAYPGGYYATASGTSMAAPHVAGAFALLRSAGGDADTVAQIEADLKATGKPIRDVRNGITKPRIDALAAYAGANPGVVEFAASAASVGEGGRTITVQVDRRDGSWGAASVRYATGNITATAGKKRDYLAKAGTLSWANGDAAPKYLTITINDDKLVEPAETFQIALSNASGATLGAVRKAIVTIVDND